MEQQTPDAIAGLDAIDPDAVDWPNVRSSRYVVRQRFSYAYPAAIHDLRQQLMVLPPAAFGDQRRTEYSIDVSEPGTVITRLDSFANTVIDVRIPVVQRAIEFEARVAIERTGPAAPRVLLPAPSPDARLLAPTERTMPDAAIERAAADLRAHGAPRLELAERVNA